MLTETIEKIKDRIAISNFQKPENKDALVGLLRQLENEISVLSQSKHEQAESIAHFAKASAHEAIRQEKNHNLQDISLRGLKSSVEEFEASHPKLTETVNNICQILANMGI